MLYYNIKQSAKTAPTARLLFIFAHGALMVSASLATFGEATTARGIAGLSCDINTHTDTPAQKSYTIFILYPLVI